MNKTMTIALALLFASPVFAEDKKPEAKAEQLVCAKSKEIEKVLSDKGYVHLLDMTAENVVQSLWIGGKSLVATAQVPNQKDVSCLLRTFSEVTLNPVTVTEIYNALQKSQKGI